MIYAADFGTAKRERVLIFSHDLQIASTMEVQIYINTVEENRTL